MAKYPWTGWTRATCHLNYNVRMNSSRSKLIFKMCSEINLTILLWELKYGTQPGISKSS